MKDRYIARAEGVAARQLGGETIVMNPEDSTFFTLNPVASAIWEAANGKATLGEIVSGRICAEFAVEPPEALADAETFVAALERHHLIRVLDAPVAGAAQ